MGGDRRPARPHGGVYGEAEERDDDYFGQTLNRVARLLSAGHGNQILLSETTEQLVRAALPDKTYLRDRGKHRLKDLSRPEHVHQLVAPDLPGRRFAGSSAVTDDSHVRPSEALLSRDHCVGRLSLNGSFGMTHAAR